MDCSLNNFMHFKVHPEQPPVHADQFDVRHEPLGLLHVPLMTVMTENKLKTNQQEQEPNSLVTSCDGAKERQQQD
jgi:hypothetical protein